MKQLCVVAKIFHGEILWSIQHNNVRTYEHVCKSMHIIMDAIIFEIVQFFHVCEVIKLNANTALPCFT